MVSPIRLQGVGMRNAIPAKELQVNDEILYNYGYMATITKISKPNIKGTIFYTVKSKNSGELFDCRTTASTLFAVTRVNPVPYTED